MTCTHHHTKSCGGVTCTQATRPLSTMKPYGGPVEMAKGFRDLGPKLDLAMFELEMHAAAKDVGAVTWDDFALIRWFDIIDARCKAIATEKGNARYGG
jgi:hypothetical protein